MDAVEEAEGGLDFTKLDAEAADLHLEVGAAEELERAVGEPADEVTGAVEASARSGAERVRNEALSGEVRAVEVAPGKAVAADEELAGEAGRKGEERGVEDEGGGVGERGADGDGAREGVAVAEGEGGGEGGVLGGPVAVDEEVAWGETREVLADARRRKGVTTGEELGDGGESGGLERSHLLEESGRQPERGDALLEEERSELVEGESVRRSEDELRAVEEGPPDFEGGGVEGDGGCMEPDVGGGEADEGRRDEASDAAVRNADTLGHARGARGEHDVGEVLAGARERQG
ncbi:hypothetical protein JY572_08680 [Myxococcus landrumensis]|uniref:Uncharacterized protein n=1 Tax=Myxococcus landrumensis TaxID=2813577 RepID=A0ABX7NES5_9BACT|nr:hypothetical protein JY572_08680 [Myxococcus landrumus]